MAVEVSPSGQIQEFISVLKRRRWQIILPALFVLLMGTVFAVIVPKKFVIKTEVELREANLQASQDSRQRKESPLDREIFNIESHLRNFSRIEGILEADPEAWDKYAQADRAQRHGMVEAIIKNLKVDWTPPKEGSAFIKINFRDVNALRGESFLANVVKVAIDDILNTDRVRLEREIEAFQQTHDNLKLGADKARTDWKTLARAEDFDPTQAPSASVRGVPTRHDRISGQLATLTKQQGDLGREKESLELHIEQLEEVLAGIEPMREVLAVFEDGDNQLSVLSLLKGAALLEEANTELSAYRPGAKRYKVLLAKRDRIAAELARARAQSAPKQREIFQEPNPEYVAQQTAMQGKRAELFRNQKAQESLEAAILETQSNLDGLGTVLSQAGTVWEDKLAWEEQLKEARDDLAEKTKALRLSRQFTREVIMDVATPAYASETAEDPNPFLIMGFSLFAGLGLGLALSLMSEYARNSYRTVPDLASVMTVPVIGSIGAIVTRREARQRLGLRLLVGVPALVILAGVSWMTWTWADEETRSTLPVSVQQAIDGIRISLLNL